jgi:hypothetical protein
LLTVRGKEVDIVHIIDHQSVLAQITTDIFQMSRIDNNYDLTVFIIQFFQKW